MVDARDSERRKQSSGGSSVLYLFRVHEGVYGDRVYEAVLGELIEQEPVQSPGFRFHWGDYLHNHPFWKMRLEFRDGRTRTIRSYDDASPMRSRVFYRDLLASSLASTVDGSVADLMVTGFVWAVAISNQNTELDVVDAALRKSVGDVYLGGLLLDPSNPAHISLTFDTLPFYGFYRQGHLAVSLDGDLDGKIHIATSSSATQDLSWFARVGANTYSTAGAFDTTAKHPVWTIYANGKERSEPLPPAPRREAPSKRGLKSLSVLLEGTTAYGAEQLLTGLMHLGSGALESSLARWPAVPNFARAVIDDRKLRDYALNPEHPTGGHKARVLRAALGFEQADYMILREKIMDALSNNATIRGLLPTAFGVSWHLDLEVQGVNGCIDTLRTAWLVDYSVEVPVPRLTSIRLKRNQT